MPKVGLICRQCNKKFQVWPHRAKTAKYCSHECASLARRAMSTRHCLNCGQEYYSNNPNRKFCCRECHIAYHTVNLKCVICGQEFTTILFKAQQGRKYCSKECADMAKTTRRPIRNCKHCGKKFRPATGNVAHGFGWFCSCTCFNAHRSTSVKLECVVCHKEFTVWPCQVSKGRKFCSHKCRAIANSGENHWRWTGGYEPYYGPNWYEQRDKARHRDNYTCQDCGATEEELGQELDVHHLVSFQAFGLERYEEANGLTNLISLCKSCHSIRHHR